MVVRFHCSAIYYTFMVIYLEEKTLLSISSKNATGKEPLDMLSKLTEKRTVFQ